MKCNYLQTGQWQTGGVKTFKKLVRNPYNFTGMEVGKISSQTRHTMEVDMGNIIVQMKPL